MSYSRLLLSEILATKTKQVYKAHKINSFFGYSFDHKDHSSAHVNQQLSYRSNTENWSEKLIGCCNRNQIGSKFIFVVPYSTVEKSTLIPIYKIQ